MRDYEDDTQDDYDEESRPRVPKRFTPKWPSRGVSPGSEAPSATPDRDKTWIERHLAGPDVTMAYIVLRFVSHDDWVDRVIRSAEMGFWASHVECQMPNGGTLLGAHIDGGIQNRPADYDTNWTQELFVSIPCTKSQRDAFHTYLLGRVGQPYDVVAIAMMMKDTLASESDALPVDKSAICSALMVAGLTDPSVAVFSSAPSGVRLTTPRDVLEMCAGAKCTIGTPVSASPAPKVTQASKLRAITHPVTLEKFVLGRKPPVAPCPRLKLKNYLFNGLPKPPAVITFPKVAQPVLSNVYLNDKLGDCVIAGMAHLLARLTAGSTGVPLQFTQDQITALYSAIGGYQPGNPATDNGCDEETALNYWVHNGIWFPAKDDPNTHKAYGWLAVDGTNPDEVRMALWLFETLLFGVGLPDAWVNFMPSSNGFKWTKAGPPIAKNGHAFPGISATPEFIGIDTWGMEGWVSNEAVAYYTGPKSGGQLYTVLSYDSINRAKAKAPNGFDWSQLVADFESMKAAA